MATFNGDHEDLQFVCNSCNNSTITVNPEEKKDMEFLAKWLMSHSFDGGFYKCVPTNQALKDELAKKEQEIHELKQKLGKE